MKKFVCSVCRHIYTGNEAPQKCANCADPKAKFEVIVNIAMLNPTKIAEKKAYYWKFDLDDIVRYLDEEFSVRTLVEVLNDAISKKAQKENTKENDERTEQQKKDDLKKIEESLKRKIRKKKDRQNVYNWFEGIVKKINREKAIKIAFVLEMTYEQTETFLKRCFYDGFYMRNIKDVIYRHGLESCLTYQETNEYIKMYAWLDHDNPEPDKSDAVQDNKYTKYLKDQYASKENLDDFIQQNKQFFGSFRRKAFEMFNIFCDSIRLKIKKDFEKENEVNQILMKKIEMERSRDSLIDYYISEKINIERKCDISKEQIQERRRKEKERKDDTQDKVLMKEIYEAIAMDIPKIRQGNTNNIRHLIAKLPTRTGVSEIISKRRRRGRIMQVDRKLLILAYLASEFGVILEHSEGEELKKFKEHLFEINNHLLEPLGMAALDPRHPFDWIIMNMLRLAYVDNGDIEHNMHKLIDKMKNTEGGK